MSELWIDPTFPRFTREELVAEMATLYPPFTDGTFRRYQELGLVAAPRRRREKGRAGSNPGMWSDHDRRMLMGLLEVRNRHHVEVGGQLQLGQLGNFVVWSWVFWDGFVELDQAKRALRTWVTPQLGGPGKGRARSKAYVNKLARMAVDSVAAPGISRSRRKEVAAMMAEHLWANDLDGLRLRVGLLDEVIDPEHTGRRVGAPGASVDAAGEIERLYMAHLGAGAVVTGTPQIPDDQWESARQLMRLAWAGYTAELPRLRAQATNPEWFTGDTGTQLARSSASLLLILGEQLAGVPAGLSE